MSQSPEEGKKNNQENSSFYFPKTRITYKMNMRSKELITKKLDLPLPIIKVHKKEEN